MPSNVHSLLAAKVKFDPWYPVVLLRGGCAVCSFDGGIFTFTLARGELLSADANEISGAAGFAEGATMRLVPAQWGDRKWRRLRALARKGAIGRIGDPGTIRRVYLRITTRELSIPMVELVYFDAPHPTPLDDPDVQAALFLAEVWVQRFRAASRLPRRRAV